MSVIKLALPKGSLEKATYQFVESAGYIIKGQTRTYRPVINDNDISIKILRPQEIPKNIQEGNQDIGISGEDWIRENKSDVVNLLNLEYGKVRIVIALPKSNKNKNFSAVLSNYIKNKKPLRISTEYLNIAKEYLLDNEVYKKQFGKKSPLITTPWFNAGTNKKVNVMFSFGATEAKPPEEADAIFDVIETGSTLAQNNLKVTDVIMESSACLIANKKSLKDPKKRQKIYDVVTLFKGVVEAKTRIHIFMNVKKENLNRVLKIIPSLESPTISELSKNDWYSLNTIISKEEFAQILPSLRRYVQGLIVHKPTQVLPLEKIYEEEGNNF
jgi:ATP phosphoribosyltransferase|tara:strand:- start:13998 stop:14981 length:984 start_codon:yes stop_codon:yes gene_type:complete